jgi:hypothetical protein
MGLVFHEIWEFPVANFAGLWFGTMDDFQVGLSASRAEEGFLAFRTGEATDLVVFAGHVLDEITHGFPADFTHPPFPLVLEPDVGGQGINRGEFFVLAELAVVGLPEFVVPDLHMLDHLVP